MFKNIDNFVRVDQSELDDRTSKGQAIHTTYLVKKIKNQSRWICKNLDKNHLEAKQETIAQEFFRLVYPFSPKTRWTEKNGNYYILSKEIPNFNPHFFNVNEPESYFIINGLLSIQVISLVLGEVDFKSGNVGVNENNQAIKIDGGWCFPTEKESHESFISEQSIDFNQEDIQALPAIVNYKPFNWLSLVRYDLQSKSSYRYENSKLFLLSKQYSCFFEEERNKTILFICLLPDELIDYFTKSYFLESSEAENLARFIIKRRNKLRNIVENIPSFISYKNSEKAQNDIIGYIDYLKSFKTIGKYSLVGEIKKYWKIDIEKNILLENLKESFFVSNYYRLFNNDLMMIELIVTDDHLNKILYISHILEISINNYLNDPREKNRIELYESLLNVKSLFIQLGFEENDLFIANIVNLINGLENILYKKQDQYRQKLNSISNGISFSLFNEKKRSMSPVAQTEDELNKFGAKRSHIF